MCCHRNSLQAPPKLLNSLSSFMTLKNKDFSLPRNLSGQKDFHFPTQHTEQESKYGSEEQEGPQASPKHIERLQLVNFFFLAKCTSYSCAQVSFEKDHKPK